MKFPTEDDRLAVNTGTPTARDQYQNGLRIEADYSTLFVTSSTTGAVASDGFLLSPDGALVTTTVSGSLPAGTTWVNGLPVNSAGAVCVSSDAPVVWANGLPFTVYGAISIGPDGGDQALTVLAKYGANAHMWLPGIGAISGLDAKNWLDAAGTIPAQEAQPVGRVDDNGGGAIYLVQSVLNSQPILTLDQGGHFSWFFDANAPSRLDASSVIFQMTDDACVIAGVSVSSEVTADSSTIYGQSNSSNHRVPQFLVDNTGKLGVYAFGGGTTVGQYGGPDNRGAGAFVATLSKVGAAASVRRNGVEVATATFSGTYGTATASSVGVVPGASAISPMRGNVYPVIVIKANVPTADLLVLEEFIGSLCGAAV